VKRALRVGLALLFACAGLPTLTSDSAWAAPANPAVQSVASAPTFTGPPPADGVCINMISCTDEAAFVLWNIKDPVFWQMAYVGAREFLAGVLNPKTDGLYGCSYPGTYDEFPQEITEDLLAGDADYQTCTARVEREALEQQYLNSTAEERVALCNQVWLANCQPKDLDQGTAELMCALFPNSEAYCAAAAGDDPAPFFQSPAGNTWEYLGAVTTGASWSHPTTAVYWGTAFLTRLDEALFDADAFTPLFRWTNPANGRHAETSARVNTYLGDAVSVDLRLNCVGSSTTVITQTVTMSAWGNTLAWYVMRGSTDTGGLYMGSRIGGSGQDSGTFNCGGSTNETAIWFGAGSSLAVEDAADTTTLQVYQQPSGPTLGEMQAKMLVATPQMDPTYLDTIEYESPWDVPVDPSPAPVEVPSQDPTVTPSTTAVPPAPQPSPNTTIVPGTETQEQTQAIGGFFDNLAGMIGGAFGWLGDLIGTWIQWLLRELAKWFKWMGDGIMALLRWIGSLLGVVINWLQLIRDALIALQGAIAELLGAIFLRLGEMLLAIVRAIADLGLNLGAMLGTVARAVAAIPGLILEGLTALFVPSSGLAIQTTACSATFPCGWVQEMADAMVDLGTSVNAGAGGGCVAPGIGWSEFLISLPPPSGCAAASGSLPAVGAEGIGDLFGWRVALRGAALLAMSWFFLLRVLALTPWAERQWYMNNPTQQTLFD